MTELAIANFLGIKKYRTVYDYLRIYYAKNGIERIKIIASDDTKQRIIEMRHGNPPDFEAHPLMT